MKKLIYVILSLLTFDSFSEEYGKRPELKEGLGGVSASISTSLVSLLGNPEKWNTKLVSVEGFLRSDFHGVMLFMSSEYCERFSEQYGVLVVLGGIRPKLNWNQLPTEKCVYSMVQGEFVGTPVIEPEPNTIVVRQRPGLINAQFIYVE